MGRVEILHYQVRKGRGYWQPSKTAKRLGFASVALGLDGPKAWKEAERLNELLDAARTSGENTPKVYPPGTLGAVFDLYRESEVWKEKEERTKDE